MQELKMGVASTEEETQAVMKVYSKEDYSVVNRFESKWVLCTGYMINDVQYHTLRDTYGMIWLYQAKLGSLIMWNINIQFRLEIWFRSSLVKNLSG